MINDFWLKIQISEFEKVVDCDILSFEFFLCYNFWNHHEACVFCILYSFIVLKPTIFYFNLMRSKCIFYATILDF